jgi:hypothetical protein
VPEPLPRANSDETVHREAERAACYASVQVALEVGLAAGAVMVLGWVRDER